MMAFLPQAMANVKTPADENLSINTRYNPEYDPQGIPFKGFTLYPSITNAVKYSDNVYASSVNEMHDYLFTVRPELNIKSDFERHALDASFFAEKAYYHDITSEDYKDYGGRIDAKVEVLADLSIPISASYKKDHVRRGSPDEQASTEPTPYHTFESTFGIVHQGQKIAAKVIAGLRRYMFDNTVGLAGTVDNGDRDRNEYSLYTSVGMSDEAILAPYIYTDLRSIDYDRTIDDNGFNRDAFQYEAGVGTILNISDITKMSFNVGYLNRSMEDRQFSDINAMTYGVKVMWEPSTLASFLLEGNRTVQESTLDNVSSSIDSSLRLSANYELFPNLLIQPSAGIIERDYEGANGGRLLTTDGTMQVLYKMNRNIWLSMAYQYINQDEKDPSPDLESYDSNNYWVSLRFQF